MIFELVIKYNMKYIYVRWRYSPEAHIAFPNYVNCPITSKKKKMTSFSCLFLLDIYFKKLRRGNNVTFPFRDYIKKSPRNSKFSRENIMRASNESCHFLAVLWIFFTLYLITLFKILILHNLVENIEYIF